MHSPGSVVDTDYADKISDKIIDLVNEECRKDGFQLLSFFAGLLLGLLGVMESARGVASTPDEFIEVGAAAEKCLGSMLGDEK